MIIEEIQNRIRQREYRFSDHSVKRMIKRNVTLVIITVYEPDPEEWVDYKVRR